MHAHCTPAVCYLIYMHACKCNDAMQRNELRDMHGYACMICTNACMPANKGDGCYTSSSFSIAGSIDGCFRLLSPCMHVTCVSRNVHEIALGSRGTYSTRRSTNSDPHVQIDIYMLNRSSCHLPHFFFEQTGGAGVPT